MIIAITAVIGFLFYNGTLWFNNPDTAQFPIRGVDVSSYQGKINWDVISMENIDFAYIKATEGSTYMDDNFKYNWDEANKTDLKVGAYHFFSYDSTGIEQAQNFINTVPILDGMLPPVIDVEFYGNNKQNPISKDKTSIILDELLYEIEKHYNQKPIIYATMKSYKLYLKNDYKDYMIWIRDIFDYPTLPDGREWTFWQYSNRVKLNGYNGKEKFIDINIFNGIEADFNKQFN